MRFTITQIQKPVVMGEDPQYSFDGFPVGAPGVALDTALGSGPTNAIYVASAGNVSVNLFGGGTAILTGLSAGQTVGVQAVQINSASTTVTPTSNIYALY